MGSKFCPGAELLRHAGEGLEKALDPRIASQGTFWAREFTHRSILIAARLRRVRPDFMGNWISNKRSRYSSRLGPASR
jgi:hypothetical protein